MSLRVFSNDVRFVQRFLKASGYYGGALDGVWGMKTDAANATFEAESSHIASEHGVFDARTERCIVTLHPRAQIAARRMLTILRDDGLDARIISGTRSYREQDELYAIGRSVQLGRKVVTNAKGGHSNHNFWIAWDIALFRDGAYLKNTPPYQEAAKLLQLGTLDIEWGGHWKRFVDPPHYQLRTGHAGISALRRRFEQGLAYVT